MMKRAGSAKVYFPVPLSHRARCQTDLFFLARANGSAFGVANALLFPGRHGPLPSGNNN